MYRIKNLQPKQLKYIKSALLSRGIGLSRIYTSKDLLILDRDIDRSRGDSVIVTKTAGGYHAAYYPSDPVKAPCTETSTKPTIIGAILNQFKQINVGRIRNLYALQ